MSSVFNIHAIAKICHEANRAYCQTLGDHSQKPWDEAPDWQRKSAINGVKFHHEKYRESHESHDNWRAEKAADGWVYGAVKDPDKKEHPCMVDFKDLPPEQQAKDALFASICQTLRFI